MKLASVGRAGRTGGGKTTMSDSVMNEYESARRSGKATRTATSASSRYETTRPRRSRRRRGATGGLVTAFRPSWFTATSLVVHPALDDLELDHRQREHEDEEDHRLRARVAELEVLEGVQVDAVDERARRVDRPASGQQVDLGEGLQHRDRVDDQQEEQRWRDHRHGDAGEEPDTLRAVEAGRLVDLLGHALQTGE